MNKADPNLEALTTLSSQLAALLREPEPGLFTWNAILRDVLGEIADFSPNHTRVVRDVEHKEQAS